MSTDSNKPSNDELSVDDPEQDKKKLKYPRAIPFIVLNEFCERFNYYGMRTVLVLYLTRKLGFDDDTASVLYHTETTLVYFCCFFGAILADSWLGKFKTIVILSCVYVCGSTVLSIGAIESLGLPARELTLLGLLLIATGSGGIKPCVAAFGGEQFTLPQQAKQLALFFSFFYFAINAGSLLSTFITPILRSDVHCFGQTDCYPLAFGVPAVLMFTSIIIFLGGKILYKIFPPQGNMFLRVCKCIGNALETRSREKKTNPKEGWLNYAEAKYGRKLVLETKILLNILVLYLPLPLFWSLFDQQGSRWTFQATRMDGDIGFMDIKPDQIQVLNPFLIIIFIPLYEVVFYPVLNLIGVRRPLQKLTLGGIFAGLSFVLSGIVEMNLEPSYPVLPTPGSVQLRAFNTKLCNYSIETNHTDIRGFSVGSMDMYVNNIPLKDDSVFVKFMTKSETPNPDCQPFDATFEIKSGTAQSIQLSGFQLNYGIALFPDNPDKSRQGTPVVRILTNFRSSLINSEVELKDKDGVVKFKTDTYPSKQEDIPSGQYTVIVNKKEIPGKIELKVGGVYTVLIQETTDDQYTLKVLTITDPNSLSMLWQIPQYVILTLGEVMFSVTGLQFSYTQAPESMRSVLQGCWQLTVAFGNLIDVFIIGIRILPTQTAEFYLFAGLMFVDMALFAFLAYRYKSIPLEELDKVDDEKHLNGEEKPSALEFSGKSEN